VNKKCISVFLLAAGHQLPETVKPAKRKSSSASIAQAVAAELEDGNLKAAIRLLVSDEEPAAPSADGLAKLREKHPLSSLITDTLAPPQPNSQLMVTVLDIWKPVISFPVGSSGGPDDIHPQHLKDMINLRTLR